MHVHLETELKWALAADDHGRLLHQLQQHCGPARVLHQENRFFDAADGRLRQAKVSVRLRLENHRLLFTAKFRAAPQADAQQRNALEQPTRHIEHETQLSSALWQHLHDNPASWLPLPERVRELLDGQPLELLGGFANQRHEFRHRGDLLCLDRSTFAPHLVDHELEIETEQAHDSSHYWQGQLGQWGIPIQAQSKTKMERFLRHVGGSPHASGVRRAVQGQRGHV